jgi:hypothetical protein
MDMIREFCEINYENPSDKSRQQKLFIDNGRNLAVAGVDYQDLREKFMGEFPVIDISFKTIEGGSFSDAVGQLLYKISKLYKKFAFLLNSPKQDPDDLNDYIASKKFSLTMQDDLDEPMLLNKAIKIM